MRKVKPGIAHDTRSVEESAAPALSRGLALLQLLNQAGPQSLEHLAASTTWPKSSVARLLSVLEKEGLLLRAPQTRHYQAIYTLTRKESTESLLRQLAPGVLSSLAKESQQTAEIYLVEASAPGLIMIDQCEPADAVAHVRARVGDRRDFLELDATAQIYQAFTSTKLPTRGRWVWRQGKKTKVSAQEQRHLIDQAEKTKVGLDAGINTHGVFRYALPILDTKGKLSAVLVIAQLCTPHGPVPPQESLIRLLQDEGAKILTRLKKADS